MKAYFDKEQDRMVFDLEGEKIKIPERPGATYGIFHNQPLVTKGHFIFEGVEHVSDKKNFNTPKTDEG